MQESLALRGDGNHAQGSIHNPLSCHRARAHNQHKTTNKKQEQKHKQTKHNPKTARPVISWSVHSHLKRIRRDDNIVSPLGLVWQVKTKANQQQHENAIQHRFI